MFRDRIKPMKQIFYVFKVMYPALFSYYLTKHVFLVPAEKVEISQPEQDVWVEQEIDTIKNEFEEKLGEQMNNL